MSKLRIFLIEDSEIVSENLSNAIHEMTKAKVVGVARSETQALEWLNHNRADIYIVDVMLQNGNGLDLLKQAKTDDGTWIVFSNHAIPALAKMATELGAHYVMDKSNEVDTLMMTIKRLEKNNARVM